jgi:hypothetical protein
MVIPLLKSHVVTTLVLFLLLFGDKDNHTIFFICVQSGWAGEIGIHFESFTVATTNWLTTM